MQSIMAFNQAPTLYPSILVNNICIPVKPRSPQEQFIPSSETKLAWYQAYYGTSNLWELDTDILITSIEKLATWWVING